MKEKARIKLISRNPKDLDDVCKDIVNIAKSLNIKPSGPISIPTRRRKIATLKTPCGDGSKTWEKWELRRHKRIIDLPANDKVMKQIMRIRVPDGVQIEVLLGE